MTAGQINPGHLGLPSSGQHLLEQFLMIPLPAILFIWFLEIFFKFFITL